MELKLTAPQDCIGDFTYNFLWQHKGEKLNPTGVIPSQSGTNYSYEDVVEALKKGEDVHINGDVGTRLASSLGVDLVYFGGNGKEQPDVGAIVVEGNAGMNAAALLNGGSVVILGNAAEFLAVELIKGRVVVKGVCKGYVGAKMTGGRIICRRTKPIPPVTEKVLENEDKALLARFGVSGMLAMNYGRYEV